MPSNLQVFLLFRPKVGLSLMIEPTMSSGRGESCHSTVDSNFQHESHNLDSVANIANVISPHCVRVGNLEHFPPETMDKSISLEDIPGDDSSLISLLNGMNPSSPEQSQTKRRKISDVNFDSYINNYPLTTDNLGNLTNFDPLSAIPKSQVSPSDPMFGINAPYRNNNNPATTEDSNTFDPPSVIPKSQVPPSDPMFHITRRNQGLDHLARSAPSMQSEQIVIVEPVYGHGLDKVTSKFFSNEIQFARNLESSIFGKIRNLVVTKNFTKEIYILKFPAVSSECMDDLLKVNKLGVYFIKCRLAT